MDDAVIIFTSVSFGRTVEFQAEQIRARFLDGAADGQFHGDGG
jgi:hypothetical protein